MTTKPSDIEIEQINPLKTTEDVIDFQLKIAVLNKPFQKLADEGSHRIQNVVTCGQFTTCAKLLEYCFTIERILEQQNKKPELPKQVSLDSDQLKIFKQIKEQLLQDWTTFKSEPLFVYEEYAGIHEKPGTNLQTQS